MQRPRRPWSSPRTDRFAADHAQHSHRRTDDSRHRTSTPDVGGSQMLEQAGMRVHGMNQRNTASTLTACRRIGRRRRPERSVQQRRNERRIERPDERAAGRNWRRWGQPRQHPEGWRQHLSGSVFLGGSDGGWQSDNATPELEARGLTDANSISHIQVFSASVGGPIKKERIWFFLRSGTARPTRLRQTCRRRLFCRRRPPTVRSRPATGSMPVPQSARFRISSSATSRRALRSR